MIIKSIQYLPMTMLLLAASATYAETTRCTPITGLPFTITREGVFCLTANLGTNLAKGNAITIERDNVTIDLNGWKLGGQAAGKSTRTNGVYASQRKNITIRNGTIRGFYRGVFLDDSPPYNTSQGHLIEDIRADRNTHTGFLVSGKGNIARRNQVVNTGGTTLNGGAARAIHFKGAGGRVLNNDIISVSGIGSGSTVHGMIIENGDSSVVENNRIDTLTSSGEWARIGLLVISSSDVLVLGNRFIKATHGFIFAGSDGKYMGNITSGVDQAFAGGTAVGIND